MAFDALWYHLTLPKLYLLKGSFYFVPVSFGLLICLSIFKIAKKYLSQELSLLAVVIFYSNLVVAWESITAYIDLSRTFFELLAFWAIIKWRETKISIWLFYSSLIMGLAISTKLLSFGTLAILAILIFFYLRKFNYSGGRFLLPYLPALSILVGLALNTLKKQKLLFKPSILFRGAANFRYLNYILGKETKEEFLAKNLEFQFGNFADFARYF